MVTKKVLEEREGPVSVCYRCIDQSPVPYVSNSNCIVKIIITQRCMFVLPTTPEGYIGTLYFLAFAAFFLAGAAAAFDVLVPPRLRFLACCCLGASAAASSVAVDAAVCRPVRLTSSSSY